MNKFIVICALNKLAPTRKIAVPYGRQKIVASIEPKLLLLLLRHPGIECPSFSIYRLAKRSDGDLLELILITIPSVGKKKQFYYLFVVSSTQP